MEQQQIQFPLSIADRVGTVTVSVAVEIPDSEEGAASPNVVESLENQIQEVPQLAMDIVPHGRMDLNDRESVQRVQSTILDYLKAADEPLGPCGIEAGVVARTGLRERDVHLALMLLVRQDRVASNDALRLSYKS